MISCDPKVISKEIVEDLYNNILFRQPSSPEVERWVKLSGKTSVVEITLDFLYSQERMNLLQKLESKKIAFLHIPKTAGTAFNSIFRRLGQKIHTTHSKINLISVHEANVLTGHFGYARLVSFNATHSFTILRDPIDRIISLYRYARSAFSGWDKDNPVRHMEFESWISSDDPRITCHVFNYYVNILTNDLDEPFGNRAQESLPLALERYRQFTCVGDQVCLDLFLKKMSATLGIPCPPRFPTSNASDSYSLLDSNYEPKPKITQQAQRRLKELTRLDYGVYNTFREREIIEAPSAKAKATSAEQPKLLITIHNPTSSQLAAEGENPTKIACHWLDEGWNMIQFDAQRFPLPAGGIPPQESREVEIQVSPPQSPGCYHLMVTLVQTVDGQTKWLHETGEIIPQIFDHKVEG